jgi:hypothetical protein
VNTRAQAKLRNDQEMLKKEAEFSQKKLELNLIKEKMADKLFVADMRQKMIGDCTSSNFIN